jgi:hypothetical protein
MRIILLTFLLFPIIAYTQNKEKLKGDTYNTVINVANGVVIKNGNITIGQIIIATQTNATLYLTKINEIKNDTGYTTVFTFVNTDSSIIFPSFQIKLSFNQSVLGATMTSAIGFYSEGLNTTKDVYVLSCQNLQHNPFNVEVYSSMRLETTFYGIKGTLIK